MTNVSKYLAGLLAIVVVVLASCTQDRLPCLTPKIASLNVRSVRIASRLDSTVVDTALPSALFIARSTAAGDAKLYISQSKFTLSLASAVDSCQWAFAADTATLNLDTLTFRYRRDLQFISNACGFTYYYYVDTIVSTHHFIDSLRITNRNVTNNVNTSHLQVFVHPNF